MTLTTNIAGRRALVTGGAGFVGSHLCEALLAAGCQVVALDDLSTGRRDNLNACAAHADFRWIEGSVTDAATVASAVAEADIVFHLAAAVGVQGVMESPTRTLETNVFGSRCVLRATAERGARLILMSTSEVYGKSEQVPFAEHDDRLLGATTAPRWGYASSKAMAELLALAQHREHGLDVRIVRLFNTIGVRQRGSYGMVVPRFVGQALAGEPLTVYGDGLQSRCFLDVADAVRAVLLIASHAEAAGEVFNVGACDELTVRALAAKVLALSARPAGDTLEQQLRLVPYEQVFGAGFEEPRRRVPDVAKIERWTGWRPRYSLDDSLRQIVAAARQRLADRSAGQLDEEPAVEPMQMPLTSTAG